MSKPKTALEVGNVVSLNSGGPDLTVIHVWASSDTVDVTWMAGGAKKTATFPIACLTPRPLKLER